MNALVVDDSAMMRKILIGALARLDITDVDQAADGAAAVSAVQAKDYSLILMDWNMPVMAGIDAIRAIRAAGKTMPIMMVTTEAEKERVMEAMKAGATSYLIKPFTATAIVNKLQGVIEKKAA